MPKKECPSCAMDIDQTEDVCPICGYEFAQSSAAKKRATAIAVTLLIVFLGIYFLLRLF